MRDEVSRLKPTFISAPISARCLATGCECNSLTTSARPSILSVQKLKRPCIPCGQLSCQHRRLVKFRLFRRSKASLRHIRHRAVGPHHTEEQGEGAECGGFQLYGPSRFCGVISVSDSASSDARATAVCTAEAGGTAEKCRWSRASSVDHTGPPAPSDKRPARIPRVLFVSLCVHSQFHSAFSPPHESGLHGTLI